MLLGTEEMQRRYDHRVGYLTHWQENGQQTRIRNDLRYQQQSTTFCCSAATKGSMV